MTNKLALIIGIIIAALFAVDFVQYDWANTVFLMRKLTALIEWIAFWR
ncbi:hypothetical protein [Roseobacter sp. CCS2]|nr:hypothetical protein [Roseobacter sp. CCS2]EBA11679.1 hypothetical protein RCCS2_17161 [Roseobacter sp. CCS2]